VKAISWAEAWRTDAFILLVALALTFLWATDAPLPLGTFLGVLVIVLAASPLVLSRSEVTELARSARNWTFS
jgi:hypothetical protein